MKLKMLITLMTALICCCRFVCSNEKKPAISVAIWHKTEEFLQRGDVLEYHFNITHTNKSSANATEIGLWWYLPDFLEFGEVKSSNEIVAEKFQEASNVKIKAPKLQLGDTISGSLSIILDPNSTLGEWNHQIVVPIQLIWYEGWRTNTSEEEHSTSRKQYYLPLKAYSINLTIPGCIEPLGMENGQIKDYQLYADSFDPALMPKSARPKSDAWCTMENTIGRYLQVSFEKSVRVTLITTWGRYKKEQWVEKYHLNYSMDGINWKSYRENGFKKELTGSSGPEKAYLLFPIVANAIRIMPVQWKGRICMRFEVHGCIVGTEENCIKPVGIENGLVPDEAFDDSINETIDGFAINPVHARLNYVMTEYPYGWMARSNVDDWLQIDLGSIYKITRFAMQGSSLSFFFVKKYKVLCSYNGIDWNEITEDGREKIFNGPSTPAEGTKAIHAILKEPVYGRYFRIVPLEFYSSKIMRIEMYGCVDDGGRSTPGRTDTDYDRRYSTRCALLDPVNNHFYVCLRQTTDAVPSCVRNKFGKIWEALDVSLTRIIGLNTETGTIYGTDRQLSYLAKRNEAENWFFVSENFWNKTSADPMLKRAVQLPDILVDKSPKDMYKWKSDSGMVWGVSGDGIHIKEYEHAAWKLIGTWRCCGA